jgi:FAD:protein FMN transferase
LPTSSTDLAETFALSRLRVALGTFTAIDAAADSHETAARGIEAAFEAIRTVDRLMHPERADSDLARLSEAAVGVAIKVHPWTWAVLALCRDLHEVTHGIFDPCLPSSPGRMSDLDTLDGARVQCRARLELDLGGIAKGYAVDRALEALKTAGCQSGLVNAGGDLAVFGPREHEIVFGGAGDARSIRLRDAALATSEIAAPSRPSGHRGHYHGVTGELADRGRVSIIAPCAAVADALTKCLLWCDRESAQELLRRYDARFADRHGRLPAWNRPKVTSL